MKVTQTNRCNRKNIVRRVPNGRPLIRVSASTSASASASLLAVLCLLAFSVGCASTKVPEVERLSLQDPRLPLEARRWLADTEDEVVIAEAGVEMAIARVERIEEYQDTLKEETVFLPGKSGNATAKKMEQSLRTYVEAQLVMEQVHLENAQSSLALAQARLTQVRAETAIRFDLTVYPLEPIIEQVEALKVEVGETQTALEDLRVEVEKRAAELWREYAAFVKKGGVTRNFWKYRRL